MYASEFGYKIKLLATAKKLNNQLEYHVYPTLIPNEHPLASVNNDQLSSMGYIDADGLDTNLLLVAEDREYTVIDDKLGILAHSLLASQDKTYDYRLGNSPDQSSYHFISGVGGDSTTADDADLELGGDDFELEWKGYVDTSVAGVIVEKENSYGIEVTGAGAIRGYVRYIEGTTTFYPDADAETSSVDGMAYHSDGKLPE